MVGINRDADERAVAIGSASVVGRGLRERVGEQLWVRARRTQEGQDFGPFCCIAPKCSRSFASSKLSDRLYLIWVAGLQ